MDFSSTTAETGAPPPILLNPTLIYNRSGNNTIITGEHTTGQTSTTSTTNSNSSSRQPSRSVSPSTTNNSGSNTPSSTDTNEPRQLHSSGSDRSEIGGGSLVPSEDEDDDEEEEENEYDVDGNRDTSKMGKEAAMSMLDAELQKIAAKVTTPRKRGVRKIELAPQRILSPPLPLLERKVVHVTHSALDFRGKKATPALFNSPKHGSRTTPYTRVLQAPVRNCLLRSLSRATKPNEIGESDGSSNSSVETQVYDYMNSRCCPEEGTDSLQFDSRFESGNLRKANRVAPRILRRKFPGNRLEECHPMNVDQEYDVWCNNDLHTRGNTQWFYFSAGEPTQNMNGSNSNKGPDKSSKKLIVRKGMTVRFNIVNMRKSDSLCNFGMRPVVLSQHRLKKTNIGFEHEGEDVCYYRTPHGKSSGGGGGSQGVNAKSMYALSFVYTFQSDGDNVYFAYNYPYTFSRLQRLIHRLELDPVRQKVFRRRLLCKTLSGNACDVLTVTAPIKNQAELSRRKVVIVSSRVHPGETVASWMMHGLIDFITGSSPAACELREKIIFKLIPMLNPDGVINGNYRCSLAGIDLNRRWDRPSRIWHPTIWHTKQMIKQFNLPPNAGRVLAYIDLHGHSRKKNVFIYGCDPTRTQKKSLLPHQLVSVIHGKDGHSKNKKTKKQKDKDKIKLVQDAISDEKNADGTERTGPNESEMKEINELVGLRMRAQLFAYIMSKTVSQTFGSDVTLSMKDSNFSVRKSKKATARVVVWNECEVMNSVTIEASFCGGGDNRKDKITKKEIVKAWKAGDLGYLSNVEGGGSTTGGGGGGGGGGEDDTAVVDKDDVLPEHYTMEDLQAMGEIICRAVKGYLDEDVHLSTFPKSMTPPEVTEGKVSCELAASLRAQEIRKRELARHRARMKLGLKSNLIENDLMLEDFMSDEDGEDGDLGSDSNPSADEMDDEELQQSATFTHFVKSVERKQRKNEKSSNKKKKSKIKSVLASRKSRPVSQSKKTKKNKEQPPSRSRLRRKLDKRVDPTGEKDPNGGAIVYDLNMSHLMKRSENYREYKEKQQANAQTIQLQLQIFHSKQKKGNTSSSNFQGLKTQQAAPSMVGSKRGGLNLFTKGREIDELRSRERYYWMMRKHSKNNKNNRGDKSKQEDQEEQIPASRFQRIPAHVSRNSLMSAPATSDQQGTHVSEVMPSTISSSDQNGMAQQSRISQVSHNVSTWTYFNQQRDGAASVASNGGGGRKDANKEDVSSRVEQWYAKRDAAAAAAAAAAASNNNNEMSQEQQEQQQMQQMQEQQQMQQMQQDLQQQYSSNNPPDNIMREERNSSSSSYMEHYASSKGNGSKNGSKTRGMIPHRSPSMDSLDPQSSQSSSNNRRQNNKSDRHHHHHHHHPSERHHGRDTSSNNNSTQRASGLLPPPVSIGFPGSYQQQQKAPNSFKNSIKKKFASNIERGERSDRGQKSGEFVAINMHRSSGERDSSGSGATIQTETSGHHDQRRFSFDATQYSSGDDAYDSGSGTVDTKHGELNGNGYPMMLHGQSSRQNQDNIKYARVIARSSSSSSTKSRSGSASGIDTMTSNDTNKSSNNRISNHPSNRQTLVSTSKFHNWPSVGRQQQNKNQRRRNGPRRKSNTGEKSGNKKAASSTSTPSAGIRRKRGASTRRTKR